MEHNILGILPQRAGRKFSVIKEYNNQPANNLDISKGRSRRNIFIIMNHNSANISPGCNAIYDIPAVEENSENLQDLAYYFKYFLIFGQLIGLVPLTGLRKARVESIQFRWKSFPVALSIFIAVLLAFCSIVGTVGFLKAQKQNANELAWSAHLTVFYATGFFIYVYFLVYSKEFVCLLKKWKYTRLHNEAHDPTLWKHVNLIAGILFTSIILENISWHFKHFFSEMEMNDEHLDPVTTPRAGTRGRLDKGVEKGSLEQFYENSEPEWSLVFEYHPALAVFVIVTNKWALYSWNYFDVLIILVSRAMYRKYLALNEKAELYLDEGLFSKDPTKWKEFLADHLILTDLLASCEKFLAPIVLVSYCVNIYNVCIHLSLGLSPAWNSTMIGSVYAIWAFAHLTIRLYMVSIYASKINEHALNICKVLKNCPIDLYDKETEKFERQLFSGEIGLTGLGYFTVTKSFMLRLLGVIFTVEIVLLQNPVTSPRSSEGL